MLHMKNIVSAIANIQGCQFASLTYLSKTDGSIARYTVNLGFSYHKAVEKSVTELEILMGDIVAGSPEMIAAEAVMASLKKTLAAHAEGTQNDDYTKKGQYIPLVNGLNLNTDNTLQLFGLLQAKVVLVPGTRKVVKSSPATIAKNKIRKQLTISKFREFALDATNVAGARVNGNSIELLAPTSLTDTTTGFVVNPVVPVAEPAMA